MLFEQSTLCWCEGSIWQVHPGLACQLQGQRLAQPGSRHEPGHQSAAGGLMEQIWLSTNLTVQKKGNSV